jgi:hypothetical protein
MLVELEFNCDSSDTFPACYSLNFQPTVELSLGRVKSSLSVVLANDKCLLSDDLLSRRAPRPLLANTCIENPDAVNTNIAKTRIINIMYLVHQPLNSSIFLAAYYGIRYRDFTFIPKYAQTELVFVFDY